MMKSFLLLRETAELFRSHLFLKISTLALAAVTSYLDKHWPDPSPQLLFFSSGAALTRPSPSVALSPNSNLTFDASAVAFDASAVAFDATLPIDSPLSLDVNPPSPPPMTGRVVDIMDENGTMSMGFDLGKSDPDLVEGWDNGEAKANETVVKPNREGERRDTVKIHKFRICPKSMRECIPCMDNEEAIKRLNSIERGERFERYCPPEGNELDCLVPVPKDYKKSIPWP